MRLDSSAANTENNKTLPDKSYDLQEAIEGWMDGHCGIRCERCLIEPECDMIYAIKKMLERVHAL